MKYDYTFMSGNMLKMQMNECFAYEGVKKVKVIEQYERGIFERIEGWLEGLGISCDITPSVKKCLLYTDGRCFRKYKLVFNK